MTESAWLTGDHASVCQNVQVILDSRAAVADTWWRMALPSEHAGGAARSLLRSRGPVAHPVGASSVRPLALRFRAPKSAEEKTEDRGTRERSAGLVVEQTGDRSVRTLVLSGELDGRSVATLERALARCSVEGAVTIKLDLRGLVFIDSAGLWTVTTAKTWCDRRGLGFSLIPGSPPVQRIFEVTGLSDVLPFEAPQRCASDARRSGV